MTVPITAAMLYDLVSCPHRVRMDVYGNPADRDEINPFVEMLWEKGTLYEQKVIAELDQPFLDLSIYAGAEKERRTLEAMRQGVPLIYSARITDGGLLGDPDLLRKELGGYVAGDIKSGAGEEGDEDNRKPKKHYAVQLALYTDILERKGLSSGPRAFVWDIHGDEVPYDFDAPYGKRGARTLWDDYREALHQAEAIVNQGGVTQPAYASGICKFCHWYTACLKQLRSADDLTLIPELGRSKRDVMAPRIATIRELSEVNPDGFLAGKKTVFQGIGPDTLVKFHERAKLIAAGDQARPYLRAPVSLPVSERELFFDIEVDPMRDHCYLHGFVERLGGDNGSERFVAFFADEDSEEAERQAFADAWTYMQDAQPCAIYYYSKYERTIYRKLQQLYPDVCSAEDIEGLFDPAQAVDLYFDVVLKATEWPTIDYSIKTLAKYLGFGWRDTHPSGAASIEWFDRWIKTGDPAVKQRILETDGTVRDEFCVGPSQPGISYHNIDIGVSGAPALVVACGALFARFGGTLGLFDHLREIIAVDMSDTDQVAMALRGILAEQSKPDFGGNILTAAMMSQCLVYLFRHLCADPQQRLPWLTALKDPRLGRAVDLILDKPAANHTVDALAQVAGMSRSAFAQHFAASFGYTPMALVHAVRMQRAADLLRDGSMPIDKVCQKVGYASRSHFSRAFKKHIGVSPIEFRGTGESSPVLAAGRLGSSLASGQTAAASP